MSKVFILGFVLVAFIGLLFSLRTKGVALSPLREIFVDEKVYVALEREGTIAVIHPKARKVVKYINLADTRGDEMVSFSPSHVEVSPDGGSVWISANAPSFVDHGTDQQGDVDDEIVVIDPSTEEIVKRIPLGKHLALAQIQFTPDSAAAYVTAQNADALYKIDAQTGGVEKVITLRKGSGPSGIYISASGGRAYVTLSGANILDIFDLRDDMVSLEILLKGSPQSIGVTPDGLHVVASLYDRKVLALYDVAREQLVYLQLPQTAQGPMHVQVTPDSRFAYVADQGYAHGQPAGTMVYKVDIKRGYVVKEIKVGKAPYWVEISGEGDRVYVTNAGSVDVSLIDAALDEEVVRIPVGSSPRGVSIWSRHRGGVR